MPLFGKKKQDKEKKGYPTQSSYPQQAAYPTQAPTAPPPPAYQYPAPAGAVSGYQYQEPPPSYVQNPNVNYPRAPAGYNQGPMVMAPPQYQPVQQTVMVQGGFDAGARFDGIAQPHIPPPPPGCAPNVAQMAAMQGHNVVVTQRQADWFSGSGDGGYVLW